jgi:integrase
MEKVFGPYPDGRGFRVIVARRPGRGAPRDTLRFSDQATAEAAARKLRAQAGAKLIGEAIDDWLRYCTEVKEIRATTNRVRRTRLQKGILASVLDLPIDELTPARANKLYLEYTRGRAPDTHQGAVKTARLMFEWARKREGLIKVNPWADIELIGKKRRRKAQHRLDEAAKLYAYLVPRAVDHDGDLAVLIALLLGFRAGEVVGITARDLDAGGPLLWAARSHEGKTENATRPVKLPAVLQAPLVKRAQMRSGKLLPFGPPWVRLVTKRACRAAGVPVVCAQALRGTHATLALEAGISGEAVARTLGHGSQAMTRGAYALPGSGRSEHVSQITARLSGDLATPPGVGIPASPEEDNVPADVSPAAQDSEPSIP